MNTRAQIPEPSLSEVRDELRSVLTSNRFRHSPRLRRLLRYLCTSSLADEGEQVSEYTIALDVLGKAEDFKEGKDAIVRVEVHRLRKRLAEFYDDEGRAHRVRIVIPTGKYVPQFKLMENENGNGAISEPEPPAFQTHVIEALQPKSDNAPRQLLTMAGDSIFARWPRFGLRTLLVAAVIIAVGLSAFEFRRAEERPLESFWNPVLSSTGDILLCIGNRSGGRSHSAFDATGSASLNLKEFHTADSQMVHVADAAALARFAGVMQARGKRYRIVSQSEATYADLRSSPVVLIGLLNNDWTKRLVGLRFTAERIGPGKVLIRDHSNPSRADWFIDYYKPVLEISKDYALVLRATDPKTEQIVVAAGGMSVFGTLAAAEFLTNSNEFRKLAASAPKGWANKNLEVVLSTDVIRGNAGPPTVVATHFW
ncbi:MAG: hypothetical protein JO108_28985 [Acidobacteriaceae bacterium]|nr:hypothetical protein [Acidobacteriaceae bacterium]